MLADPYQLDKKLREYCNRVRRSHYNSSDESGDDSDSSCSSDSDSDDSDSSDVSIFRRNLEAPIKQFSKNLDFDLVGVILILIVDG